MNYMKKNHYGSRKFRRSDTACSAQALRLAAYRSEIEDEQGALRSRNAGGEIFGVLLFGEHQVAVIDLPGEIPHLAGRTEARFAGRLDRDPVLGEHLHDAPVIGHRIDSASTRDLHLETQA